ncbi:MAG TPA: hypothetical protein VF847_04505 [Candidatus Deferrimicrobiaceae bacterium]
MSGDHLSDIEKRLLVCLLGFYREIGPGATPGLKGLDEEADLAPCELREAVNSLRARGLIEYWELQPAVRLTPDGLRRVLQITGDGGA